MADVNTSQFMPLLAQGIDAIAHASGALLWCVVAHLVTVEHESDQSAALVLSLGSGALLKRERWAGEGSTFYSYLSLTAVLSFGVCDAAVVAGNADAVLHNAEAAVR